MENTLLYILMLAILFLANATAGGCFPSSEEAVSHVWLPGGGTNFYGVEATLDVYGFTFKPDQASQASIWIANRGDGNPSSLNGFQAGWHISPTRYKDSNTHFYTEWTSAETKKGCLNMECPGFQKTSTSIAPGDIINPVSDINGKKQYITIRLFKDKSTGDWHVYYGFNGAPKPVGYFPESLLPGLKDKPVEISFGGLVYHRKPQPSPPMGNGLFPATTLAASFSGVKLIDEDGNNHDVTTDLPYRVSLTRCYFISTMSNGLFFYGGPGCDD
ncbi:hypothetical protein EJB05_04837 [Eragrostis curvula]|uniref:Neprosin PEP catalytic domain-containing protein n=1 Tax=Eragrostis curvula TaxID=38414 RepID=A0A5J9W9F9_9POAL|nr:hypothetical protein EJB05_04837 [Eragrostis curvula]